MAKIFHNNNQHYVPSSRTVELTVLSGEDLRISRRLISKNAFVTVRYDGASSGASTAMDTEGGSYPRWAQKFVLELPANAPAVSLEVHCKTAFGTGLVGTASVPVSDFSGGYVPDNYLHFLSYRLRDSKTQRNGIINISVTTKAPPTCSSSAVGVPLPNQKSSFGGVVTGVPIWGAYN